MYSPTPDILGPQPPTLIAPPTFLNFKIQTLKHHKDLAKLD